MYILYRNDLAGIDWPTLKAALVADHFDNGRTAEQLKVSFHNSEAVCFAWSGDLIIGTARVLSDGICNAYLVDVWTQSSFRRRGIAREMIQRLLKSLPGQHVYLQADRDIVEFYERLGFAAQPAGMSLIVGKWLQNDGT